jgi:hypothetical protein
VAVAEEVFSISGFPTERAAEEDFRVFMDFYGVFIGSVVRVFAVCPAGALPELGFRPAGMCPAEGSNAWMEKGACGVFPNTPHAVFNPPLVEID